MTRTSSWLALAWIAGGLVSTVSAAPVIGTFDSTRATTANLVSGIYTGQALASLNAHFPGLSYATSPTLTPAFLSGVDILVIGSPMTDGIGITPLSAAEQSALLSFVQAGGRAFLVADGYSPFEPAAQSMIQPFGMTIVDDGLSGVLNATPTAPLHSVIDGPFGVTTSIDLFGAGILTGLGPATPLADMDALNEPVLAAIEQYALGPTSGRVVVISDASFLVDDTLGGFFPQQQALFLNAMSYLAAPEPAGSTLSGIAAAVVGLASIARTLARRKARVRRSMAGRTVGQS